jgi:hypothetical protein
MVVRVFERRELPAWRPAFVFLGEVPGWGDRSKNCALVDRNMKAMNVTDARVSRRHLMSA